MPQNTPRGYTYPLYSDPTNLPAQLQELATDVDADVEALDTTITATLNAPSARVESQAPALGPLPVGANTTLTYTDEIYDNAGMVNLGANNSVITINTPGIYVLTGYIRINANASAAGGVLLRFGSTGALVPEPALASKRVNASTVTRISLTTLHYAPPGSTPQNISLVVFNNALVNLTAEQWTLAVSRVSA
ncbi:MAG TPA: hypothetical protein VF049_22190 [Nocardioidaceae bacterium]